MTNDTALDYVDRALRLAQKRHHHIQYNVIGGKTLEPMYNSIVQQLIYLHKVITSEEKDKTKLWKLTFGMYATKEFEATDPIFEDRLGDALFIASHIGNGLKVRLPHEIEPDYYDEQKKLKAAYPDDFDV
ncbi:immunity protein Tsi6 family protein [Yersinia pseudotuberculosis]|uniref:immunity protein Tsi6 family protein n=1 Tax=Yersinia pseudotuberculosis TaxID=633 RepID=UPI00403765E4